MKTKTTMKILSLVMVTSLAFTIMPITAAAATDVTAYFTDSNFRAAVRTVLGIGSGDPIYDTDCATVASLDVSKKNISSLAGIEHFTALTSLNCNNNRLTALDVSNNTALTSLLCYYNQLTALDVRNNTALTNLYCNNNQLTALDMSKNTNLLVLNCSSNQLTDLDVKANTALQHLHCLTNRLTALDTSNNTELTVLNCNNNRLTALDVRNNTKLNHFYGNDNWLTALDVSKNTKLTYLFCNNNQLTALDVRNNTALTDIYCYNNRITTLDVGNNTALTDLHCHYNYLANTAAVIGFNKIWDGNKFKFEPQHASGFYAVTNIIDVPYTALINIPLTLTGRVVPSDAKNKTIVWSINVADGTGATINGDVFTASAEGTARVKATITNGGAIDEGYTQYFAIVVKAIAPNIETVSQPDETGVTVKLNHELSVNEKLITAVYNASGQILGMSTNAVKTGESGYSYTVNITIPPIEGTKVNVMWWNGINTLKPLCPPKTLEYKSGAWHWK